MAFFSVPSNLLAVAAVVALVLFVLRPRIGAIVMALSLAAIAVVALSPLGHVLLTPLEQRFPQGVFPAQRLEGIIVLGGSYDYVREGRLSMIVLEDDTEPLAVMVDLAHRYPEAKIIVTGGSAFEHGVSASSIMKEYFVSFGIAPERIVTEDRSLSTAQNAQFTADLLHPSPSSRWLLVAYGHQMPRAVGAFRKAGFNVSAFPIHPRTNGWSQMWQADSTGTENLRKLDIAVHEWAALLHYKLKGYSDEWFAGSLDTATEAQLDFIPARKPPAGSLLREAEN